MKKGFHPWQHDDSGLVDKWKTALSPYFIGRAEVAR
jgi:predicted metal-dependent hydrolase